MPGQAWFLRRVRMSLNGDGDEADVSPCLGFDSAGTAHLEREVHRMSIALHQAASLVPTSKSTPVFPCQVSSSGLFDLI
jgi:hypothetical protein